MNQNPHDANHEQLIELYNSNLARQLEDVTKEYERRLMKKSLDKGHKGLKMSFAAVLSQVGFSGSRLVTIAERNSMTKQAIGQIADEIEALGYIKRKPDPSDGRAKNVVFTKKGEKLIRDSVLAVKEVEEEFVALIGREKLEQLKTIMAELSHKLELKTPD